MPTLPFICLPLPHGNSVSAPMPWSQTGVAKLWGRLVFTEVNAEEETEDILCCNRLALPLFLCLLWHRKDPRGRNGQFNLPRFSSPLPKTSMKCVQLKDSLSPRVTRRSSRPHSTGPAHSFRENRKVYDWSGVFFVRPRLAPKHFAHSARTHRRRLTLWMGSVGYHYTPLRRTSKPASLAPLEVGGRHFFGNMTLWQIELLGGGWTQASRKAWCSEKQWNIVSELWLQVRERFSNSGCISPNAAIQQQNVQPQNNVSGKMLQFYSGREPFSVMSSKSNYNNLVPRNTGKILNFFRREKKRPRDNGQQSFQWGS